MSRREELQDKMWNAEDGQVVGLGEPMKGLEMALASRSLVAFPQGGDGAGPNVDSEEEIGKALLRGDLSC